VSSNLTSAISLQKIITTKDKQLIRSLCMSYYPYGVQQYSPIYQPQYQMQQQPTQQPSSGLNCKIVDSLEVSKIQEVPFGSFGVFPKGDLSEVYIKSWNGDGTTKVIVYD